MKNIKIKSLIVAIGMIGATAGVNSQWMVTNSNDELYFGKLGTFTQSMGDMQNTVKSSIDQMASLNENKRQQDLQALQEVDQRNRVAMGSANIANKNALIYPTVQGCVDLTQRLIGAGAQSAANSGGSSGGTAGKKTPGSAPATILSEASKQALVISEKPTLGTCSVSDAAGNVNGCSAAGNYGGTADIPSSDVSPLAIKGNTSKKDKLNAAGEFANYTLSEAEINVANQSISNATLYNAPKALPDAKLKENTSYKALYDGIMTKLNTAQQALKDILSARKAPTALAANSLALKYWTDNSDTYKNMMGMTPPKVPSLMDLMIFNAANDYSGIPSDTATSQEDLLKRLNDRVALNNMIAIKQLAQQENTNILLSSLLTQAVTPTSLAEVNAQYNKIMTGK